MFYSIVYIFHMIYIRRVKKSLPEKYQQKTQSSLLTAVVAAAIATGTCYPLDTIRRQMQLKGTPYKSVLDAFSGRNKSTITAFILSFQLVISGD